MNTKISPVFTRFLIAPSPTLIRVLNKFTTEGTLKYRLTPTDVLAVNLSTLGETSQVSKGDARLVIGDPGSWGITLPSREAEESKGKGPDPDGFLLLGRKGKISQEERIDAHKKRFLTDDDTYRSHQERVNEVHAKLDAEYPKVQRNAAAILGNRNTFKPLQSGETATDGTESIGRRIGIVVKTLRFILGNSATGNQFRLAVCENEKCREFFIKTRRDKRRCSPKCTRQHSARDSMRESRALAKPIVLKKKLQRVRAALKRCPRGATDPKAWVCDKAGVSKKWMTLAVNQGILRRGDLKAIG
jgi:hypothetical protein